MDAIGREFGYLFFHKRNIKNLVNKVTQLEESRDDIDRFFEAQIRKNEEISQSSAGWLKDVEDVTMAAKEVVEAKDKLRGWCLNLKNRYVLGRKSTKLAAEIQELQDQATKRVTTCPALPAAMLPGSSSNDASRDFKSRMEIMDKIMEALRDDKINIIGICGLGGIGKTTILHDVRETARNHELFDKVVITTVSQDTNLFKIQSDLASMLGLTSINDVDNIIARADLLYRRLINGSKILIILDDVWGEIKFKEVGIPVGYGCATCKVVLASRYRSVCTIMGTQMIIFVEFLSKEEAWNLFKKTAGDSVERENLEQIAKEVADECGGLPIALVTLARALSNKKRIAWEDAHRQLRQSCITSIPEMNKKVYSSIRLSYDSLASELPEAQLLLLICSQHPVDAEIKVEKLARYCLALELFKNVDKVVDARNRTYAAIDHLKSCFLLQVVDVDEEENDWEDETVKMHDVVRDVCLSSVSEVNERRDRVYMHIMAQDADGGYAVDYPKLKLLMEAPLDGGLLDISFFQQMEELRVFENLGGDEYHPPLALHILANLRMLSLERESLSKNITTTIGSLRRLEILSFWLSKISSFPHQIGQLSNLKLLDLRCTAGECLIPSGILPRLNKLEELYMGNFILLGAATDNDIQSGRNGESHGRITELDSLSKITTLQIILVNPRYLLDLRRFRFEKLNCFFLASRDIDYFSKRNRSLCRLVQKTIKLGNFVGMEWVLEAKIMFIARSTEDLQLEDIEDWTDPLILKEFMSLKKLDLRRCKQLEYIPGGSLGELRVLKLTDMPVMRCLWVGPIDPLFLVNLREVAIRECPAIESIFLHLVAKCLVQLQDLTVQYCLMLEGIVSKRKFGTPTTSTGGPPDDFKVQFPKLRRLILENSPKLRGFYNLQLDDGRLQQPLFNPLVMLPSLKTLECYHMHRLKQILGGGMLELPKLVACDWLQNLEEVWVGWCNLLETVFDFEGLHVMGENAHVQILGELKYVSLWVLPNLEHLCKQIPKGIHAFQKLKELNVERCGNMRYLISSSVAHMLVNLKSLSVAGCDSMREVIKMNEECCVKKIVFRSLSKVILEDLEKLLSFCSSNQAFVFPSLEEVFIVNCPDMKTFCSGHLTAEKLHGVKPSYRSDNDDKLVWNGDLNETVLNLNSRISRNPALPGALLPAIKTTTNIRDKVMEALKDDKMSIIGICGLGGIGKTKLLQEVCERARTQKLFDEVAMTTVSQDTNLFKIQRDLANKLGLTHIKDVVNIHSRADLLQKRLTNGSKILVVLDDVRSAIKLEEVGIPSNNGCSRYKVVLASRNESVCTDMGSEKNISVGVLSTEEAWHVFKKTAGDCVERDKLEEIAKEVADECGGVPIALVTLARALSNKKRGAWEDARGQLRQSSVTIPDQMNKDVYRSIMLSYNILASEQPEAQPLLWICCQHPEDAEIKVEKLARYCLALELFENVDTVDARNRTYEVIDHLKSCFLLRADDVDEEKNDRNDETVKMHDVVRNVCLSIVSDVKDRVYMHIMADGGNELGTSEVDYPKLKLLMEARHDCSLLDKSFLEQMEELRVFENLGGDKDHPPLTFQVFVNLRMLSLECMSLSKKITSTIGRLQRLEILSFWHSEIPSFPRQIGRLSNLKLLDLRCAAGKGPIPSGILRGLNKLEVLYMGNFILLGGAANNDIQRVSDGLITELDCLSNLRTLQIVLVDPKDLLSLRKFDFEKLESFFLASSTDTDFFSERNRLCPSVQKTIELGNFSGMEDWILGPKIQSIARSTVDLTLEDIEDWTDPLILKEFMNLKKLDLRRCKQLEYIPGGSLGELELLKLTDMPALRRLWVGPTDPMCLVKLREVVIRTCPVIEMRKEPPNDFMVQIPKLRGCFFRNPPNLQLDDGKLQQPLFNPSVMLPSLKMLNCFDMHELKQIVGGGLLMFPKLAACDWLQNLEVVRVSEGDSLETVFDFEGLHVMGENANVPRLGKLKCVRLSKLPNLEHLCWKIPKGIDAFQNLGELNVESCGRLGYLISSSMAHMLVNLKSLSVGGCNSMKEAIKKNEDSSVKKIVFHILSRVILQDLKNLSSFCSSDLAFEFPLLGEVLIVNCPKMKTFCCGHLTTEKLHGVKVSPLHDNDDKPVWKNDLNGTVKHLNASVKQMNRDLEKDDVSEDSADEDANCINETELSRRSSSNFVESIGDNDKILWTEVVLYKFLDAMVEEVHKGNRTTTTFSREGWNFIINALKHYNITKTQCTNKFDELKNEYTCFKNLCKETGIVVNRETGMIYAEDQVWEKLKKVIKGCDMFRKSGCPYFLKLQIIFENDDDNEDLQNKRCKSFDSNLGLFMQQMSENAKKCTEILEKQFGQASQSSETIRDSGGDTYVKLNEDLAQFSECVDALNELNGIDGPSYMKAIKVLREDPFMRVAFLKFPSDKRKDFVLSQ